MLPTVCQCESLYFFRGECFSIALDMSVRNRSYFSSQLSSLYSAFQLCPVIQRPNLLMLLSLISRLYWTGLWVFDFS